APLLPAAIRLISPEPTAGTLLNSKPLHRSNSVIRSFAAIAKTNTLIVSLGWALSQENYSGIKAWIKLQPTIRVLRTLHILQSSRVYPEHLISFRSVNRGLHKHEPGGFIK